MLQLNYLKMVNWQDTVLVDNPDRPGEKMEHPWNLAMGVFMMHTGIRTLTRANAAEFYMRAKLVETCFGALFTRGDGTPRYLTTADVIAYIGLSSNVSSYSKAEFFGHLRKDVIRSLTQTMEYALKDHDAEVKAKVMATVNADPELRKINQGDTD